MIARLALYLHVFHQIALGQHIPAADPPPFIPDCEGDILFLLDSSGSVSYYEFANVKGFIGELLQPFTFGPNDVQASMIHISTTPILEFPFNQHTSSHAVQQAIQDTKQYMGDTNTGQALSFAKEKLFTEQAGARANVPKVLLWVTDGISTDDIAEPMKLLKDMGVTVFVVSTGRGNYRELSAAASQPPEDHLYFVDVDDLPIITKDLRDSIIEVIRAKRLKAQDITSSSFRLTWPQLLSASTGHYVVEYAPVSDTSRKLRKSVTGDQTGVIVSNLAPETTYEVTLIPETNVHYMHPQTIRVTTLEEAISPAQILISDSRAHSFQVSWSPTPDNVVGYHVLYGPLPGNSVELLEVEGNQNSTTVDHLMPNTTYLVTVAARYKSGKEKALSAKACTQEENSKVRHLRFEDVGPNSLKASWDAADGNVLGYQVRCRRQAGSSSLLSVPGQVHNVVLKDLAAGTSNKICVKPMYRSTAGRRLCRMVHIEAASTTKGYEIPPPA
ncbi:von Willebrand factor A domain-containing protein 1 isoform X1 [Microcaecilia unicolor]|uniref:von Willebrand factor A domain-containing protein 1 n=1 Tax=Microcaecilia unicolor TaxID=1415580 RepID=A0A6P7WUH0_9AMPH|nr:von Willebrand factor A domain-containing protein 1 isoform X1 [Microcaecilia unicolor]